MAAGCRLPRCRLPGLRGLPASREFCAMSRLAQVFALAFCSRPTLGDDLLQHLRADELFLNRAEHLGTLTRGHGVVGFVVAAHAVRVGIAAGGK